jgi:hypothetical protein
LQNKTASSNIFFDRTETSGGSFADFAVKGLLGFKVMNSLIGGSYHFSYCQNQELKTHMSNKHGLVAPNVAVKESSKQTDVRIADA